jgi:hypothetical protein
VTNLNSAVTPELVAAALDASDAEERRQATSLIAELFLHDALPLLIRALGDEDWRVRKEATHAARAFVPAPNLVNAMVALFEPGENVGLRNAAVDVLALCGSAATRPLSMALGRLDADGRKLVVQALGTTRDTHALSALAFALDDDDSNVRQGAVEAISRLGPLAPAEVQRLLLRSVDADDPFCQLAALDGLNALGAVVPWDRLEKLLEHPTLRTAALTAAAMAEDPRAPAAIARGLRSARGHAFVLAVGALARLAEGPLLPDVAAALAAEGPSLGERLVQSASTVGVSLQHHRVAALLLAAISEAPGVVDAAAQALEDARVSEAADRALRMLGPKVLLELVERIAPRPGASTYSSDVRAALIDASAAIAQSSSAPASSTASLLDALRSVVHENDGRVTASALWALSRLGNEQDLELAARFVRSSSKTIAYAAEAALSTLTSRHPAAARRIIDSLAEPASHGRSEEAFMVAVLIGALAALPGTSRQSPSPADIALLTRCAAAEDSRTRRAAIEAIAEIGGESSLRVLSLALADDAREVQIAAARALGLLGRRACFRDPAQSNAEVSSLRAVIDVVTRSTDAELLATAIRTVGEDLVLEEGDATWDRAIQEMLAILAPLARDADGVVAIAAVESIGRLPSGTEGRQLSLAAALHHSDDAVVKAAILKFETSGSDGAEILECLDHPSPDVRSLAAESLAASDNPALRGRLAERTSVELDLNFRDTLEGALSSIPWRGERSVGGS